MTDKANPLALYHQRQLNDQAQPVAIYGGGSAGFDDLIPVTPPAEPEFTPYAYLYVAAVGDIHVLTATGEDRFYPSGTLAVGPTPLRVTKVYSDTTATVFASVTVA